MQHLHPPVAGHDRLRRGQRQRCGLAGQGIGGQHRHLEAQRPHPLDPAQRGKAAARHRDPVAGKQVFDRQRALVGQNPGSGHQPGGDGGSRNGQGDGAGGVAVGKQHGKFSSRLLETVCCVIMNKV